MSMITQLLDLRPRKEKRKGKGKENGKGNENLGVPRMNSHGTSRLLSSALGADGSGKNTTAVTTVAARRTPVKSGSLSMTIKPTALLLRSRAVIGKRVGKQRSSSLASLTRLGSYVVILHQHDLLISRVDL